MNDRVMIHVDGLQKTYGGGFNNANYRDIGATAEHYHRASEELYFFTSGTGRLRVGDEQRDVRAGECVVIPPGEIHKLVNTGDDPLRLLCCCAPAYSDDDTVLTGG